MCDPSTMIEPSVFTLNIAPLLALLPDGAPPTMQLFADPLTLFYGALTGFLFGFLLQKGGVTRFKTILGQFLLTDFTVLKVMGTAIVVGAIGIFGMRALGMDVSLSVRNALPVGNIVGGTIFGVGMVILGYCPGTAMAAIGDGSRHAIPGLIGGLVGASIYGHAHPWLAPHLTETVNLGKLSIDGTIGLSPWWVIAVLAAMAIVGFTLLERWERKRPRTA